MKIGYLHIGIPQREKSGVTRYSRLIAAQAHRSPDLKVIEADVILSSDRQKNRGLLNQAASQLSQAEVIHIQFNKYTWGEGWRQLDSLKTFINQCSRPTVVTLHDIDPEIYPGYGLWTGLSREYTKQGRYKAGLIKRIFRTVRDTGKNYLADRMTLRWLSKRVQMIFVCTEEEARRLNHLVDREKVKIIPHFVEERAVNISPSEARVALGLEGFKVVTLQGFIYGNKGHALALNAIPQLPPDVMVVFAGGAAPNNETFLQDLLKLAQSRGVSDRLRITGYLAEEDLERYLVATHLAICPFKQFSASGSLSTWISVVRPILASDLPQIAEYNRLEPGAIHTFNPYTASDLAAAIQRLLPLCQDSEDSGVARLREKLSMPRIFDEHLKHYQDAARINQY